MSTAVIVSETAEDVKASPAEIKTEAAVKKKSPFAFILRSLLTFSGFLIAILVNLLFPQVADVPMPKYILGNFIVSVNGFYRLILLGIILIYFLLGVYAFFDDKRRKQYLKRIPFRFACGVALAVWDIFGTKLLLLPQPFFPGPAKILESFLIEGDFIFSNTLYSLRLFSVGFIGGVVLGVGTGILIGWFPKVYYWVSPVLNIIGVIPAVAWMPFALTLMPTNFAAAALLIMLCSLFPVSSLTAMGIQSTPKTHFEAARTLGAKTPYLIFRVAVPHAMPSIFTGITTANASSFMTLVMSEMMGQPGGLGYYINLSKVWSAYYKVFAAIIVMAVLFSLITFVVERVQNYVLRWQRGILK